MKIVFMGTTTFSLEILKMLDESYNVVGVVTQPDRMVGRKRILTPSIVKEYALDKNIPVIQPVKIREDYQEILDLHPDIIITAAYGQIIPKVLLDTPRLGCINVHASLLPEYRGGAPVHQAIIDGKKETGVSVMYMDVKMDAGDIISQAKTPITDDDNVGILYDRLSILGRDLLKETLPEIINGTNKRLPQDEEKVTYAYVIKREDERIDWSMSNRDIFNKIRGLNPFPGSYTLYDDKNIKLYSGYCIDKETEEKPGTIIDMNKEGLFIQTGNGIYVITELQIPGKKKMLVKDYLNGKVIFELYTIFQ